jgi:hypothetical protein
MATQVARFPPSLCRQTDSGYALSNIVIMSQSTTATGYVEQVLPDQYITIRVLDDYINARKTEFGNEWSRQVCKSLSQFGNS